MHKYGLYMDTGQFYIFNALPLNSVTKLLDSSITLNHSFYQSKRGVPHF